MTAAERIRLRELVDEATRERLFTVPCPGCREPFRRNHAGHIYCTHQCGARHWHRRRRSSWRDQATASNEAMLSNDRAARAAIISEVDWPDGDYPEASQ